MFTIIRLSLYVANYLILMKNYLPQSYMSMHDNLNMCNLLETNNIQKAVRIKGLLELDGYKKYLME